MSCWTKESGHLQIKGTDSSYTWLFFFYLVEERRQKNNSESRLLRLTENNLIQANTNRLISNSMLMSLKSSDSGQICEMYNVSIWGLDSVQPFPGGPGHPRWALDVDLSGLGSPRLEWFRLELLGYGDIVHLFLFHYIYFWDKNLTMSPRLAANFCAQEIAPHPPKNSKQCIQIIRLICVVLFISHGTF